MEGWLEGHVHVNKVATCWDVNLLMKLSSTLMTLNLTSGAVQHVQVTAAERTERRAVTKLVERFRTREAK